MAQAKLIERITRGAIPSPRQIRLEIPRDLETIVLKATAREPRDRYQSADDLAGDLKRFLADKPPLARRTSPLVQVWPWCRRNRLAASLMAAAVLLLITVALTASVGYLQTRAAFQRESLARQQAETATELGLEVLDKVYGQLAPPNFGPRDVLIPRTPEGEPGPPHDTLSPETAVLLENILPFYDRLAAQSGDTARFQQKSALANRRVGDIRRQLGQVDQAEAAYQRAIAIYTRQQAAVADVETAVGLASVYNELGQLYAHNGQAAAARQVFGQAERVLETHLQPDSPAALRYQLARTYYFYTSPEQWHSTDPNRDEPPRLPRPPHPGQPFDGPPFDNPPFERPERHPPPQAMALDWDQAAWRPDDVEGDLSNLQRAVVVLAPVAQDARASAVELAADPGQRYLHGPLGRSYRTLGEAHQGRGDLASAQAAFASSRDHHMQEHPAHPALR